MMRVSNTEGAFNQVGKSSQVTSDGMMTEKHKDQGEGDQICSTHAACGGRNESRDCLATLVRRLQVTEYG